MHRVLHEVVNMLSQCIIQINEVLPIFFHRKDKILYTLYMNSNSEKFGYAWAETDIMYAILPKADIFSLKKQYPSNP